MHDSFSSIGVTLALVTTTFAGRRLRYVGRSRSLAEFRREPVEGLGAAAQRRPPGGPGLGWFARNVLIKALIVARLRALTRALGHHDGTWPY